MAADWLAGWPTSADIVLNEDKRRSEPISAYRLDQKHGVCSKWYPMGSWARGLPKTPNTAVSHHTLQRDRIRADTVLIILHSQVTYTVCVISNDTSCSFLSFSVYFSDCG